MRVSMQCAFGSRSATALVLEFQTMFLDHTGNGYVVIVWQQFVLLQSLIWVVGCAQIPLAADNPGFGLDDWRIGVSKCAQL